MFDLRPLNSSGFRPLAATYGINELGNWIGEVALAILVFDRTRSPLATATLFLAMRVIPALVAPLLTARLESAGARPVLSLLYVVEAAFFVALALVTRHFSLPLVLALVALDGAAGGAARALTRGAMATALLPMGLLREGNGLVNLIQVAAGAIGPALAGFLVSWQGAGVALYIDAGSFMAAAVIVALSRGIAIESDEEASTLDRVRAGVGIIRSRPVVRRLVFAFGATLLFGSVAVPIEIVFAKSTLHAGDVGYGVLLASWGVGAVVGGIGFLASSDSRLATIFTVGTLLMALGYCGLAVSPSLVIACAFSAVGGVGNGAAMVALFTAVQERIPVNAQSTVSSVIGGLDQVMPGVGFVIGGAITALSSPRVAYGASAAGLAVVVIAFYIWRIGGIELAEVPTRADAASDDFAAHLSQIAFAAMTRSDDTTLSISTVVS